MRADIAQNIDLLFGVLQEHGGRSYFKEPVSQLEHSLQVAHLAVQSGAEDETVIAALLHDIGQIIPASQAEDIAKAIGREHQELLSAETPRRTTHAVVGAEYLRSMNFSQRVCDIVGGHVLAKRYLTTVDNDYFNVLSEGSKRGLMESQGGLMSDEEVRVFEQTDNWGEMVRVRRWDDQAKVPGIESQTPRLEYYRDMVCKHLQSQ